MFPWPIGQSVDKMSVGSFCAHGICVCVCVCVHACVRVCVCAPRVFVGVAVACKECQGVC